MSTDDGRRRSGSLRRRLTRRRSKVSVQQPEIRDDMRLPIATATRAAHVEMTSTFEAHSVEVPTDERVSDADRQAMIATAAYLLSEKRRFEPGHELDDWLAAEAAISKIEP